MPGHLVDEVRNSGLLRVEDLHTPVVPGHLVDEVRNSGLLRVEDLHTPVVPGHLVDEVEASEDFLQHPDVHPEEAGEGRIEV